MFDCSVSFVFNCCVNDARSVCFWLQGQCCSLLFLLLRQICALIVFDCCVWDARSFVFECYVRDARSLCVWLLRQWCVLTLPLWCALSLFVLNCCISDAYGLWSDTRNCCFPLQCRGQFLSLSEALHFFFERTKFESRDKQQQARVTSLEKEKTSICDELKNTVNELTQVRTLSTVCMSCTPRRETGLVLRCRAVALTF